MDKKFLTIGIYFIFLSYFISKSNTMAVTSTTSFDEMVTKLNEYKQEHIYQIVPDFNIHHPIFQQVYIYIYYLLL